jgi:acyl-CoA thioesterase-2
VSDESQTASPLLDMLDFQALGQGVFSYAPPASRGPEFPRLFGGQLLAQALAAACQTVPEDLSCHSLHAYFVRPGKPGRPIEFEVAAIRDGQNFVLRKVMAVQRDELDCELTASFERPRSGPEFRRSMPDVPDPESFPAEAERTARLVEAAPEIAKAWLKRPSPIEFIQIDPAPPAGESVIAPVRTWARARGPLPSDPNLHCCALAYASDMGALHPSLRAIGAVVHDPRLQVASLDHALWFHRPFRFDEWHLFVFESDSVAGGRGFNRGSVFDRRGVLVASIAQEGLMRERDSLPGSE